MPCTNIPKTETKTLPLVLELVPVQFSHDFSQLVLRFLQLQWILIENPFWIRPEVHLVQHPVSQRTNQFHCRTNKWDIGKDIPLMLPSSKGCHKHSWWFFFWSMSWYFHFICYFFLDPQSSIIDYWDMEKELTYIKSELLIRAQFFYKFIKMNKLKLFKSSGLRRVTLNWQTVLNKIDINLLLGKNRISMVMSFNGNNMVFLRSDLNCTYWKQPAGTGTISMQIYFEMLLLCISERYWNVVPVKANIHCITILTLLSVWFSGWVGLIWHGIPDQEEDASSLAATQTT